MNYFVLGFSLYLLGGLIVGFSMLKDIEKNKDEVEENLKQYPDSIVNLLFSKKVYYPFMAMVGIPVIIILFFRNIFNKNTNDDD